MSEWRKLVLGERIGPLVKLAGRYWPQGLYIRMSQSIDQVMINNETSRDRMQQCQRMEQRVGRMT
mgnify:CR=1 FL=1